MYSYDLNIFKAALKHEAAVRLGFIWKVYSILSMQLLLNTAIVGIVMASQALQLILLNYYVWLIGLALLVMLVSLLVLICFPSLAREVPVNYLLLCVFTVSQAILVAETCVQYDPTSVFWAVLMACAVTLVLTWYAFTFKSDFSWAIEFMLVATIIGLFFTLFMPIFLNSRTAEAVICCCLVLIYGVYIIIATQLIAGRYKLTPDDYILGSLYLYVDVIILFLASLRFIGEKRD